MNALRVNIQLHGYTYTFSYNMVKKLLATHSTGSIGYYLCLIMQTQFQLGRYTMHALVHLINLVETEVVSFLVVMLTTTLRSEYILVSTEKYKI